MLLSLVLSGADVPETLEEAPKEASLGRPVLRLFQVVPELGIFPVELQRFLIPMFRLLELAAVEEAVADLDELERLLGVGHNLATHCLKPRLAKIEILRCVVQKVRQRRQPVLLQDAAHGLVELVRQPEAAFDLLPQRRDACVEDGNFLSANRGSRFGPARLAGSCPQIFERRVRVGVGQSFRLPVFGDGFKELRAVIAGLLGKQRFSGEPYRQKEADACMPIRSLYGFTPAYSSTSESSLSGPRPVSSVFCAPLLRRRAFQKSWRTGFDQGCPRRIRASRDRPGPG